MIRNKYDIISTVVNVVGANTLFYLYYLFFYKTPLNNGINELLKNNLNVVKSNSLWFSESLLLGYSINYPLHFIAYFLFTGVVCFLSRNLYSWKALNVSKPFIWVVFIVSLIFTYNNSLSDFNFFTEKWYYFDRILLLVSSVLLLFTPLAFLIYFPLLFLFFSSFNFPLDSFSLADKTLPIVLLFSTMSLYLYLITVRVIKKNIRFEPLWLVGVLITICCSYLAPLLIKISISQNIVDWFIIEDFALAFEQYLDRGWLLDYPAGLIDGIRNVLVEYDNLFLFIAVVLECLGIFLFFNWRYSIGIIVLLIILNTNIYLLSAILFWKWIISNILIIYYLYVTKPELKIKPKHMLAIVLSCVLCSHFLPFFPKLGWYTIPYKVDYLLEVTDVNGDTKNVKGKDMAPFDMYFTFSRWDVLNKNQANISNLDPNEIIRVNSMSIEQIKDEIKQRGVNKYNPKKEKILALFLNEYFTNYNKVGFKKKPILSPPAHIQYNQRNHFKFDTPVRNVKIVAKEFFYENHSEKEMHYHVLNTFYFN